MVDEAIANYPTSSRAPTRWAGVVTALCELEEFRLAEIAQRYAVPVLEDLIAASGSDQVQDMLAQPKIQTTAETVSAVFEHYIYDAIRKFRRLTSQRSSISDRRGSLCSTSRKSLQQARRRRIAKPR